MLLSDDFFRALDLRGAEDFQAPIGGILAVEASLQQPNVSGAAALGYWPAFWILGAAYRISPGFWRVDEGTARQPRDLATWKQSIRDMITSAEPWQLVITFNEWGEGTSVEPADAWQTPFGYGEYLDALHTDGA